MRKLRKIWKITGGAIIAVVIIATVMAYVMASTDVKLSMVNSSAVVTQGGRMTLSVNMSGTDDNNPNPSDKSPIPANIEWTTEDPDIFDFVDATSQTGYSETVSGNSSVIHANFAGISTITATYYSKIYDAQGQVSQKIKVNSTSLDAVVPIIVSLADNDGRTNISSYIYDTGDSISITANTYKDNPIVVTTSNTGVVSVASSSYNNATLSVVGGGSTKVTVRTADGDGNTNLMYSFTVNSKVNFTAGTMLNGERVMTLDKTTLTPFARTLVSSNVITPSQSGATWLSADTSVFTAFNNGEVLGLTAGSSTLTAGIQVTDIQGNKTFLLGSSDVITIIVPFKWLNTTENMNVSDKFQLSCTGKTDTLTWSTSDNSVLTVDSSGVVTAVGSGTANITVSRPTDPNNQTNKYGETYSLTTTIKVIDTFGLSTTNKEINIGETFDLKALTTSSTAVVSYTVTNVAETGQTTPPTGTIVTYKASTDGKTLSITGVSAGTVRVVATQNIKGLIKTAECLVYVRTPVGTVTLNPSNLQIDRGSQGTIQLIFNPSNPYNSNVLWTSSNTAVATVTGNSSSATIKGVTGGTATISVITMDGLKVASCEVYVREPVTGISLNATSVDSTMAVGSYQLTATILPAGDGVNRNVEWTSSDPAVATVSPAGLVKFIKPGFSTIICRTVDGSYMATCNFFVSIPVTSLKLDYSDEIMSVGGKLRISAEVLPLTASNRTVSWTSSNTNVCVVDSNGLVQAVGVGNATILCKSLDGAATAMCNIYVKQPATSVVLNQPEITVSQGQVFWLNATVLPENADNKLVTWSSSNTALATVDANGKVTTKGAGVVSIIATNTDTGLTGFCIVTITQPVTGLTLNSDFQEMWVGSKYAIIPYVLPTDAVNKKVTYLATDTSVATVDANGIVTAVKGGTTQVVVTTEEVGLTATVTISVKEYVSTITLNEKTKFLNIGNTTDLLATVTRTSATNKNIIWTSTNNNVVTVDTNGHCLGISAGTAVVTATAEDGSGVSASCVIRVVEPVTGISIEPSSISMLVGDSQSARATIYPDIASIKNVTWTSSNEKVAMVDADGEIFALSTGKAKITATATDGTGISASIPVYVTPVIKITALKINSSEISMLTGKTRQLTARITPTNTTESVNWYSTDTSVVVVEQDGRITTVGPGTAQIVLTGGLNNVEGTCTIHSLAISNSSLTIEQYDTFDVYVDGAASGATVSWRSANPRVATVTTAGHIVARMAGTTTVTATIDGKTLTCVVRVTNIK